MTDYAEQIEALRARADELMAHPDYWRNERMQREAARLWADVVVLETAAEDALPDDARTTGDAEALRRRADEAEVLAHALADDADYGADDMQDAVKAAYAEAVALQDRAAALEAMRAGDDDEAEDTD